MAVRLDSGDLLALSQLTRCLLDEAGFSQFADLGSFGREGGGEQAQSHRP
jgi:hypothetical protein